MELNNLTLIIAIDVGMMLGVMSRMKLMLSIVIDEGVVFGTELGTFD